jgi:hypothetical protein
MKIYLKRLLKGVLYSGLSLYYMFHEFGTNWLGSNAKWNDLATSWAQSNGDVALAIVPFLFFVLNIASLIYFIKGLYFLRTMHVEKLSTFEMPLSELFRTPSCDTEDSEYSNIDKIKKYRDSKMTTMTNEQAAEEYKKTAWLDGLTSDSGKNTQSVKRYVNSSLAAKSNEQGYQWLKEKGK